MRRVEEHLPSNPALQYRMDFNSRYVTIWNMLFQVTYCILSLICDITSWAKLEAIVPGWLRRYRYTLLCGGILPLSFGLSSAFWPLYFYDRELIYPKVSDLVMTQFDNYFSHLGVLLFSLWELALLPKDSVSRSSGKFMHISAIVILYVATNLYTGYVDIKSFPYDILNVLRGTVWFWVVMTFVPLVVCCGYHLQWRYRDWVWSCREEKDKIK
ncbi:androgen-dependent TFPI-regulating protein-like [Ostrinia furnacalis]|uniref:androgen-dependent TFPI-regulating protein-like n=1 Tax=Ostrinia furnacalis TaxID=93504 RepID=UPI001038EDAF|nr:androgen-dependent TFPI-regulating protein-like [Ostrinia furnacalis]